MDCILYLHYFSLLRALKTLYNVPHIHTQAAMQCANLLIRSNLRFSVLLKDNLMGTGGGGA